MLFLLDTTMCDVRLSNALKSSSEVDQCNSCTCHALCLLQFSHELEGVLRISRRRNVRSTRLVLHKYALHIHPLLLSNNIFSEQNISFSSQTLCLFSFSYSSTFHQNIEGINPHLSTIELYIIQLTLYLEAIFI
jgi:hypothetical protein